MQHQRQSSAKELNAAQTGAVMTFETISAAEIERHIAEGKRMQAEAVASLFKAGFRRLGNLLHLRPQGGGELSRA